MSGITAPDAAGPPPVEAADVTGGGAAVLGGTGTEQPGTAGTGTEQTGTEQTGTGTGPTAGTTQFWDQTHICTCVTAAGVLSSLTAVVHASACACASPQSPHRETRT